MDSLASQYTMGQMQNTDQNTAGTIQTEVAADNQKQEWRRWQIMQDTQTKIFEIQQEVTVHKAQTGDKMCQKWDEYMKQ